jgi:hypothetical protein
MGIAIRIGIFTALGLTGVAFNEHIDGVGNPAMFGGHGVSVFDSGQLRAEDMISRALMVRKLDKESNS